MLFVLYGYTFILNELHENIMLLPFSENRIKKYEELVPANM